MSNRITYSFAAPKQIETLFDVKTLRLTLVSIEKRFDSELPLPRVNIECRRNVIDCEFSFYATSGNRFFFSLSDSAHDSCKIIYYGLRRCARVSRCGTFLFSPFVRRSHAHNTTQRPHGIGELRYTATRSVHFFYNR